jgi:hypothetical protein
MSYHMDLLDKHVLPFGFTALLFNEFTAVKRSSNTTFVREPDQLLSRSEATITTEITNSDAMPTLSNGRMGILSTSCANPCYFRGLLFLSALRCLLRQAHEDAEEIDGTDGLDSF